LPLIYRSLQAPLAGAMLAKWSQENFFKYAREHYNLDRLADYRIEAISDPLQIVNPDHRRLDGQCVHARVNSLASWLSSAP
jgi:hypothetical protein